MREGHELGRGLDILVLAAAGHDKQGRQGNGEQCAHQGLALFEETGEAGDAGGGAVAAVGGDACGAPGVRPRSAIFSVSNAESMLCGIVFAERLFVQLRGLGRVLLGVIGIAAHLVVTRCEGAWQVGKRLQRLVGLALIDLHARQPQARDVPELGILGMLDDLLQWTDGPSFLICIDRETREHELCLVGIR